MYATDPYSCCAILVQAVEAVHGKVKFEQAGGSTVVSFWLPAFNPSEDNSPGTPEHPLLSMEQVDLLVERNTETEGAI